MCSPYWNVLGYQILYFLEFFYYLLSHFENRWSNGFTVWLSHRWISDFQSGWINSKKIPKNVKFGLQAHFNMENTSNGLDRLFGLRKLKIELIIFRPKYNRKHISHTIYIYMRRDQVTTILSYNKVTTTVFFHFQSPNRRSKTFNTII